MRYHQTLLCLLALTDRIVDDAPKVLVGTHHMHFEAGMLTKSKEMYIYICYIYVYITLYNDIQ